MTDQQKLGAVIAAIVLYALLFYTKQVLAILILCAAVYLVLAALASLGDVIKWLRRRHG